MALYGYVNQQAGVAVEPDRLHVEQEGEQEAEEDGEELDGVEVAHQVPAPRGVGAAPGHHRGDERAQRDGRRRQHRRRHDAVPQRLHRQHAVLRRILKKNENRGLISILTNRLPACMKPCMKEMSHATGLHHGLHPDAAVDGVDADDGGGGVGGDPAEKPCVVGHHGEDAQGDEYKVECVPLHGDRCGAQRRAW